MVDAHAVNTLLVASRAAHDRKRLAAGRVDRYGKVIAPPNWPVAEQHIAEALRLRLEAHALDPDHTASGWRDDLASDDKLIAFYVAYAKPFIPADQLEQVYARFPDFQHIQYIP